MNHALRRCLCRLLSGSSVFANQKIADDKLITKFINDSLSSTERKVFSRKASIEFDTVHSSLVALKYSEKKGFTDSQLKAATQALNYSKARTYRESSRGIQFHWYLSVTAKEQVLAHPIIVEIDPKSSAYKSGLRKGDVVVSINKQTTEGHNCLESAHILLRLYPTSEPITFQVKRAPQPDNAPSRVSIKKLTEEFTFKLSE